jgi:hypothetical protein
VLAHSLFLLAILLSSPFAHSEFRTPHGSITSTEQPAVVLQLLHVFLQDVSPPWRSVGVRCIHWNSHAHA